MRLAEIHALLAEEPPWVAEGYERSDDWGDEQDRSDYFEARADALADALNRVLDAWRG